MYKHVNLQLIVVEMFFERIVLSAGQFNEHMCNL